MNILRRCAKVAVPTAIFVAVVSAIVFLPRIVYARTEIEGQAISQNTSWSAASGPYDIVGAVTIEKGATLTIHAGSTLNFSGGGRFEVKGSLLIQGTTKNPIQMNSRGSQASFTVQGGELDIDNAKISVGSKIIDAYASSTIAVTNTSLEGITGVFFSGAVFSIWQLSSLLMTESSMQNINTSKGIEVFNGGSITLENISFSHVGSSASVVLYDTSQNFSVGSVKGSTFTNAKVGIQAFQRALVEITDSEFTKMSGSGLLVHTGGSANISSSTISENNIGIEAYSANVNISNSSIEGNTQYGAFVSGGSFNSINNWWGEESGPYHAVINTVGKGNEVDGTGAISPWLTEKPKKQTPCCSNVLFLPGIQGSRIYKKQLLTENQLWEPNRNADVKKLFLNSSGVPVDTSLYTKDIINRTNIGAGYLDRDVYKPFTDSLDARVKNYYMREWKAFPYDWRMSPEDIVSKGIKTNSGTVFLEDTVRALAVNASNKKVTIVAHSYGGLVAQALVKKLQEEGRASMVDKVIMVGVPEEGSVDTVSAMLHGDGQELGRGVVLKADVARSLGINMPSAYYLLPNQTLLSWLSGPIIHFDSGFNSGSTPSSVNADISDVSQLDYFLGNTGNQRSIPKNTTDVQQPAKLNSALMNFARAAVPLLGPLAATSTKSSVEFINIMGTGLKTIKSLTYKNISCTDEPLTTTAFLGKLSCGLNHTVSFSDSGDGTVLTGNIGARQGSKLVFNIASYNKYANVNYSHTNFISSVPIIQTIAAILGGGPYPPITPWGDYVSYIPAKTEPTGEEYAAGVRREAYQFSTSKNVLLSATAAQGKSTGFLSEISEGYAFPAIAEIPNSLFSMIDLRPQIVSEEAPEYVSVKSFGGEAGTFSIEGIKISPSPESLNGTSTVIFSFDDVPISPDTNIRIDNIIPSTGTSSLSTSSSPIMHIDRDGDGIFESSVAYNADKSQLVAQYISGGSGTGAGATSTVLVTPEAALQRLRSDIASGMVSKRFTERYMTRTNPVASYLKKNQTPAALVYASKTSGSLAAIVKELSRARSRYYSGGLTRAEASHLYFSWADFSLALKNIISLQQH